MNIKQIIFSFALALGFAMSGTAMAATVWGETTDPTKDVTGGVGGNCALLGENVKLSVSANVVGGYACDEAANLIQVASCHAGGSRNEVKCDSYAVDDPLTTDVNEENLIAGCSDTTGFGDPSFRGFFASSAGGIMAEAPLNGRCTETALGGLSNWAN